MMIDAYRTNQALPGMKGQPASSKGASFTIDLTKSNAIMGPASDAPVSDAYTQFVAETHKTPQQRCKDEVMEEWHVTQGMIDAMPPDEARAMTDRIDREVARRMQLADPSKGVESSKNDDPSAAVDPANPGAPDQGAMTASITTAQMLGARMAGSPPAH